MKPLDVDENVHFIVHDSINLNAQCTEGCVCVCVCVCVCGRKIESHTKIKEKEKDSWCTYKILKNLKRLVVQSHSQNRCVFRHLQNAANESASLIVCGVRAFQSLGVELEMTWKPNCIWVLLSSTWNL